MATKNLLVTYGTAGLKSVNFDALPKEAWRSVLTDVQSGDVMEWYDRVPTFSRAVNLRADAVTALPWSFQRVGGDYLPPGEWPSLPFSFDMPTTLNTIEASLVLYGVAYLFKGRNVAGIPRDVRPLHPASMRAEIDDMNGLVGFERTLRGKAMRLDVADVVYVWSPNRGGEIGPGRAPAVAAAAAAGLLLHADQFAEMYFDNGPIAPTLVTLPVGTPTEEKHRLEAWAKRAMSGLRSAFNIIGLTADVKVTSLGNMVPLKDIALESLIDKKREDVAAAFGVPIPMLFSSTASYNNAEQGALQFHDLTVIPSARRIEAALNCQLFEPFGWRLRFRPDLLEMYQQQEAQKAGALSLLYDRGILTREEVREQMGLLPSSGGTFRTSTRRGIMTTNEARTQFGYKPVPGGDDD